MYLLQRLLLLQQEEKKVEKCKGGGPTVTICSSDEGAVGFNLAEGEGLTQHSTECHQCALGTEKKNSPVLYTMQFLIFCFLPEEQDLQGHLPWFIEEQNLQTNFQGTHTHTLLHNTRPYPSLLLSHPRQLLPCSGWLSYLPSVGIRLR